MGGAEKSSGIYDKLLGSKGLLPTIETKSLNGHTGLHQDNIIFLSMEMDKVLDLNGHTVNAICEILFGGCCRGYLINICDKDARLTIRDSVGGGAPDRRV